MQELFYDHSIENSIEDNNVLDKIFRDDVIFNIHSHQDKYSSLILLDVYQELKHNKFSNAEQILKAYPTCIDMIISVLEIDKLLQLFLFFIKKKLYFVTNQIWITKKEFPFYFLGLEVTTEVLLGNPITTKKFKLSFSEINKNFRILIEHTSIGVIRYICSANPLITSIFSGKNTTIESINNNTIEIENYKLPVEEVIFNFLAALHSKNVFFVKEIWDNNPNLSQFFRGHEFKVSSLGNNINTDTNLTFKLSISELIDCFKIALITKSNELVKYLWKNTPTLVLYFNSIDVSTRVGSAYNPQNSKTSILCLTFKEILENFELSLCCNDEEMIQNIWRNNALLADFFTGKTIDVFEHNLQGELYLCKMFLRITKLESIFKLLINNRQNAIINCIWTNHPIFANYFSGELIYEKITNIRGEIEFQPLQLKDNEILSNYNLARSCKLSYICELISQKRPEIISNLTEMKSKPTQQSLLYTCDASTINYFQDALDRKNKNIVKDLLNNNKGLSDYLSGKIIRIQHEDDTGNIGIIERSISTNELIKTFKNALTRGIDSLINQMWENNPLLHTYFSGQKIESQIVNSNGIILTKTKNISFEEVIEFFPKVLDTKNKDIIDAMWNNIPQLQLYFSGYKITPLNVQILADELIENFKKTLSLKDLDIIERIWGDANSPIQQAIQKITLSNLINLIEKVISICKFKKTDFFVTKFLNSVSNKSALEHCLNKIKSNKSCYKQSKQIKLLTIRISTLDDIELEKTIENDPELNMAIQELINDYNHYSPKASNSSYVATQTFFASNNYVENKSLKRKLENEENQSINKRKYF